ncbi:MAG: hypothetical protein J7500_08545 [Sphingomonas sp.]|uniref:hypothetical protein n=1 Tax=Sphingomonas sp. TaxID=28214 RepID=UPI001B1BFE1A|nr:hypothetical protein [Sphingomonas sp.]MBO9622748.1 hypothetical protein [Sphingomonas sp.]
MTEWLVAIVLIVGFLAAMPWIVRWAKSSGGKGRMGGVAMALGLAFSAFLDPAQREAMENVEDEKSRAEQAGQGELLD